MDQSAPLPCQWLHRSGRLTAFHMDESQMHSLAVTLLVVENSRAVRERMVAELQELPAISEISEVGTLSAAQEAVTARTPCIVILDIQLPDGSGLELLRTLQKRKAATGIIVFTTVEAPALLEACEKLGTAFIFSKFTEFEHVKAAVQQLAARRCMLHPRP